MIKDKDIIQQLSSLIQDDLYEITVLANTSAFLHANLADVSWTGFYLYKENALILGPFQGKVACTYIPKDKGVCGKCASTYKSIIVENVHEFPTHIACDSATNSEIVIPLIINNELYGVLDIDSTSFNRFNKDDQQLLEACCEVLTNKLATILK